MKAFFAGFALFFLSTTARAGLFDYGTHYLEKPNRDAGCVVAPCICSGLSPRKCMSVPKSEKFYSTGEYGEQVRDSKKLNEYYQKLVAGKDALKSQDAALNQALESNAKEVSALATEAAKLEAQQVELAKKVQAAETSLVNADRQATINKPRSLDDWQREKETLGKLEMDYRAQKAQLNDVEAQLQIVRQNAYAQQDMATQSYMDAAGKKAEADRLAKDAADKAAAQKALQEKEDAVRVARLNSIRSESAMRKVTEILRDGETNFELLQNIEAAADSSIMAAYMYQKLQAIEAKFCGGVKACAANPNAQSPLGVDNSFKALMQTLMQNNPANVRARSTTR